MAINLGGWFLGVTGFIACPCHFPITLPLAAGLLGGSTAGAFLAGHIGWVYALGGLYFLGALLLGFLLLSKEEPRRKRSYGNAKR
ncbi:MAG: mercury resistance protein [Chloroflexi bacterium]|nr:mercury resistance protein [Chloroflexota bacterium]